MDEILGPLAFALLIGGQFLAAIVLISTRKTIYADPHERVDQPILPTDQYPEGVGVAALPRSGRRARSS
jgi:hypothetical protein